MLSAFNLYASATAYPCSNLCKADVVTGWLGKMRRWKFECARSGHLQVPAMFRLESINHEEERALTVAMSWEVKGKKG
jgi:hypothetical protein